jgi:5-methyltetrahydrofolate--homocysteine methyltransferase
MTTFKKLLEEKKVIISDGAWGTELMKIGFKEGCPEIWNLTHPEEVKKIAQSYIEAGSEIIMTNTFGGSFLKLKKYNLESQIIEINKIGVEISRAVANKSLVFASMGPTGEFLSPVGEITEKEMIENFIGQVKGFIQGKADGIVLETMSDINEVQCAIKAIRELSEMPVIVSMTFSMGPKGFATIMGITPEKFGETMEKEKVDAIGTNCTLSINDFISLVKSIKNSTSFPIWVKPNAGIPQIKNEKIFYPDTAEYMTGYIKDLIQQGAKIIGGCCGTTPQHIKLMVKERNTIIQHEVF